MFKKASINFREARRSLIGFKWSKPKPVSTRQSLRRKLFELAFAGVTKQNPKMARSERRSLARAYATGQWRKQAAV